ncbi:MAG TPA: putative porin [Steroidobacteraceae bacterium]|nr:putative porin [Steroidobacteraceae bacterium]
MSLRTWGVYGVAGLLLLTAQARAADDSPAERQSMEELRNTVVNLLQALVDKGLLTREQAEQLVKQAQDKAAKDAAALAAKNAAQAKEEQNAVRVPYVPQIVKDEISKQVAQEVKPAVVQDVVKEAKAEGWGVPASLPEWLSRVRMFGDVTIRGQADLFPKDNSYDQLLDFNAVNSAGGITAAADPFIDTTEDRYRLRLRARLGVEGDLTDTLRAYIRLASGSLTQVAGSESQTLGTYGNRYTVGIDQAYIVWDTSPASKLSFNTIEGGRTPNPWFTPTELVYARDLTFEGVNDTMRVGWGEGGADRSHVYLTLGAIPMLEVPLQAQDDKWLLGAQLGTNLRFRDGNDHLRFAVAYYDFLKVSGELNSPYSVLLNYTAPPFVQWGNTMFNIANNPSNPTEDLFALAAHFRIVDLAANYEHAVGRYDFAVNAEAVRNIGYNLGEVEALSNESFNSPQDKGYVAEVSFGDPVVDRFGLWRVALGYRYVQADAVIDAWTDADFHEGGTNTQGYYLWASFGFAPNTWVRLRYLSGNEITGPRYGDDIVQLDVNTRF